MRSKKIEETRLCLDEGVQKNQFNDEKQLHVFFNKKLASPMYQPSEWRHAVGVVDGFFYHLDNEDIFLFQ